MKSEPLSGMLPRGKMVYPVDVQLPLLCHSTLISNRSNVNNSQYYRIPIDIC
jgi:hypothetical protein